MIGKKEKNMQNKLAVIFLIFSMSCNPDILYIDYNSIAGAWHKDSVQNFNFELNKNEKTRYSSFINLRINEDYIFNNIFLIVTIKDSINIVTIDTIEHKLADKYGNFLGRKRINIVDNSLLHEENISLDNKKKYFVSIEHAMRAINKVGGLELLEGVVDVGFKIEIAK
ncbi:MAG: gliding motility lipoprotein GldH [Flavobacteriaceae bacterium]|nr:gliding motility lipoprotein GldH [Flavobacteriaceae bacterium]